jgi:hypothetical protein
MSLLRLTGRPPTSASAEEEKRRVRRKGGLAEQLAEFVDLVCSDISAARNLASYPVSIRDIVESHPSFSDVLTNAEVNYTLARNAVILTQRMARAFTTEVIGTLAVGIPVGEFTTRFNDFSESTVRNSVVEMRRQQLLQPSFRGLFQTMNMPPNVTRAKVSEYEKFVTSLWFHQVNPSRSGDQQLIAWMSRTKAAFFNEVYRVLYAQIMVSSHICIGSRIQLSDLLFGL